MKNITVIGAGTMGNGIAHTFAQNGFLVNLIDTSKTSLEKGLSTIENNLNRLLAKEKINIQKKENTLNNITTFTSLKNSVLDADLVIEAATENESIKLDIFKDLEIYCPEKTIFASNTSSISITKIASVTNRPHQVIGMHFMNPVPLMELVEVINGYSTEATVTNTIIELTKTLNKTPVLANDFPGFVANRILMPMINEAIITLNEGVSGVFEIDSIMTLGMAHPMGPLKLADFIGLDVCLSILNVLKDGLGNQKYAPSPLLINMVNAGKLGVKSGEGFYNWKEDKKNPKVSLQFT